MESEIMNKAFKGKSTVSGILPYFNSVAYTKCIRYFWYLLRIFHFQRH